MSGQVINLEVRAVAVTFPNENEIEIRLVDGRALRVPLRWSKRLSRATPEQRARVEFLDGGRVLSWPEADEDIEVEALLKAERLVDWPDGLELPPKG